MRRFAAWIAWWIALFWLWLLLAGEWNRVELVAAGCAATAGAFIAEGVRAFTGVKVRIPVRDVASAWTLPVMVFVDFGIVIGALLRSAVRGEVVRGRFVARDFDPGAGFGSRAWRTYAATVSPNAYVVDADEELRVVLLHDLVPYRKSEEPAA
jgi:hypothetical protein